MTELVSAPRLRDAIEPWCVMGATGALRLLAPPGGAVYLSNGRVAYAECPTVCGVDRLLTTSGRLSTDAWRTARAAIRGGRPASTTLVQQGLLSPLELEMAVLSALYGAAHFLFEADSETRFEMDARHAFGGVVELHLDAVRAEIDRRQRTLLEAWPDSTVDSAAVLPVRRLPGHHVALTPLQWEIVANADRRRTPVDLARVLGRDTFAMLLEVRRLTRAGLVEPGRPGLALARGIAEVPAPDYDPLDDESPVAPPGGVPVTAEPLDEPAPDGTPLPRRTARTEPYPVDEAAEPLGTAWRESTLLRIRDALKAL